MDLFESDEPLHIFLILHTSFDHTMRSNTYIPWDEWGRDIMVMEMPMHNAYILVQGVQGL